MRGYLEAISLVPPGGASAEEGAPPPPTLELQYEVQLPAAPPAEERAEEAAAAAEAEAGAGAEAVEAEAGAAEAGPEVDEGGDVGEELAELPSLPRLEATAGEMLPGIALRLVRERS